MSLKKKFELVTENFDKLLWTIKDCSGISDTVKIKISTDQILIYSLSVTDSFILALKSYSLKTQDFIKNFDLPGVSSDFIFCPAAKSVKSLSYFDTSGKLWVDINYKAADTPDDINHIRSWQFSAGKLKINHISCENTQIKDLNKNLLDQKLDIQLSKWGFKLSLEEFQNIKRLSSINPDDRVLTVNLDNGLVKFSEMGKWELEISDVCQQKIGQISFLKKYLSSIDPNFDWIDFWIFETFILVKGKESLLMLSYEQDFT